MGTLPRGLRRSASLRSAQPRFVSDRPSAGGPENVGYVKPGRER